MGLFGAAKSNANHTEQARKDRRIQASKERAAVSMRGKPVTVEGLKIRKK